MDQKTNPRAARRPMQPLGFLRPAPQKEAIDLRAKPLNMNGL